MTAWARAFWTVLGKDEVSKTTFVKDFCPYTTIIQGLPVTIEVIQLAQKSWSFQSNALAQSFGIAFHRISFKLPPLVSLRYN